jgi:hypothetical protein
VTRLATVHIESHVGILISMKLTYNRQPLIEVRSIYGALHRTHRYSDQMAHSVHRVSHNYIEYKDSI